MRKDSVYKKKYQISISNVNINKRLGLVGLLDFLQDIATLHAEDAGFGLEEMIRNQSFWVLVRQKLNIQKYPQWNDEIEIHTWSRKPEGMYAFREFEFFLNGELIGNCSTVWMILDGVTRKIKKPDFPLEMINPRKDYNLNYIAERVNLNDHFEFINSLVVRNSDIDLNMHVNNTKYSQWVLDSISIEKHKSFVIREYEINFLLEVQLGDKIDIFSSQNSDNSSKFQFKGVRDKGNKPAFYAEMLVEAIP